MLEFDDNEIVDISDPPPEFSFYDIQPRSDKNSVEEDADSLKIYTSYYGNIRNLSDFITISISRSTPIHVDYHLIELAPSWSLLNKFKDDRDEKAYIEGYKKEVLGNTSPHSIIGQVRRTLATDSRRKAVFLCYEKRGDFCHRHIVSQWLRDAGYSVEEV